jgi:hypothetical protein
MDTNGYRRRFAEFLATQPEASDITYEQVARAQTREELGISSLNMILILVNYLSKYTDDTMEIDPEWVSRLSDIDGIVSVLREIDASQLARAEA